MKKIDYKLIDLKVQKMKKAYESYITLYDDYLESRIKFKAETQNDLEDETLGTKEDWQDVHTFCDRYAVCSIEKYYLDDGPFWVVTVNIEMTEPIKIYYNGDQEDKAQEMLDKLTEWRYGHRKDNEN